jgi:transposase
MMIVQNKNQISYRIFKRDTSEVKTFVHALDDLIKNYQIEKVIVVADRGMLSKDNLEATVNNGYEFIIGERLKSLHRKTQEQLLDINAN